MFPVYTQPLVATEVKHCHVAPPSEGRQASNAHRLFGGTPLPWQVLCSKNLEAENQC